MNKLFVDTNAFEEIGYNFDEKNPIIYLMIKNVKDSEYSYYNLSVIDNEISSHIKERWLKDYNLIKKRKWINKYISEEDIKNNCYKDMNDYNNFKESISAIKCDVSKINPEEVFKKYFKVEYPFEKGDKKRKEFPDAFISEYVNGIELSNNEKIYFVTNDEGLKKSLNNYIIIYNDLESFLSDINNIQPKKFKEIEKFILNNIELIQQNILNNMNLEYFDLEDETIDVDSLKIQKIVDIKVIGNEENKYYVSCKCDFIVLSGDFSCLDYNNSYMTNDCDFYVIQEYIKLKEIPINDYEFMIEVFDTDDDNYSLNFMDKYDIKLDYELMEEANYDEYFDYDGEDSFTQDGGLYR